jgi:signal transduction histidine kinase
LPEPSPEREKLTAIWLEFSSVDLREFLGSTLSPLAREAERLDVELRVVVESSLPRAVCWDSDKIAWALATLVGNALRYVRHGTVRMPGGSIEVVLSFQKPNSTLAIEVRDDGSGISAAKLAALFERTSERPHVSGLGLKLIRDIAEAHGGTFAIESRDVGSERGTTVRLRIPLGDGRQS